MKFLYSLFFSIVIFQLQASDEERLRCIERLRLAFELQSRAFSYLDSYNNCVLFNVAQAQLEKMGEPKAKIEAIRDLWIWYRIYGHSCGIIENPVQCPDEYVSSKKYISQKDFGSSIDYKQQRYTRDFLFGVGAIISGVFCITVNPPIAGKFGVGLVSTGIAFMWNALNNMVVDSQEKESRLSELERLKRKAEIAAK